jgi:threonine aldolase
MVRRVLYLFFVCFVIGMKKVDLRSDTLTQPTEAMRVAMANAVVGDDVYGEDMTVKALEKRVADMFQKEAALFFPSGTMSNLTAVLAWCSSRGSEIVLGDQSHMFLFEQGGASQFGGVSMRTVPNLEDGTMELSGVLAAIRDEDIHEPSTQLICIENTHNVCGGKVLPFSFLENLRKLSVERGVPIHMDGARIWNALSALGVQPDVFSGYVDSISVCLSKGLGAPVGSLLVGSEEFIHKAIRIRKALGGGMRQSGILAAAGLVALDDFSFDGVLVKDHERTRVLAEGLRICCDGCFSVRNFDTNILFLDLVLEVDASAICKLLKVHGVFVSAWSPTLLRMVVHRDIDDSGIQKTLEAFRLVSLFLLGSVDALLLLNQL